MLMLPGCWLPCRRGGGPCGGGPRGGGGCGRRSDFREQVVPGSFPNRLFPVDPLILKTRKRMQVPGIHHPDQDIIQSHILSEQTRPPFVTDETPDFQTRRARIVQIIFPQKHIRTPIQHLTIRPS